MSDQDRSAAAPRYLTLRAAAELCSTSPETIRFWIHQGKLRAFKPGRSVLVREDELRAFVESTER